MTTTEPDEISPSDPTPTDAVASTTIELPSESHRVGLALDANHAPETNGWMSVCRRCGMRTDGPEGLHVPPLSAIPKAEEWLQSVILGSSIAKLKSKRDT